MNKESEKYTCSRCFIEIREDDGDILVLKDILNNKIYDLCKFCREEFNKWMKQYFGKDPKERNFEVDTMRLQKN